MTTFKVKNPLAACDIGDWCNKKFSASGWELKTKNLFSPNPQYEFSIKDKHDALMFALKWAEFA